MYTWVYKYSSSRCICINIYIMYTVVYLLYYIGILLGIEVQKHKRYAEFKLIIN